MYQFVPAKMEEILKTGAGIVHGSLIDLGYFATWPRNPEHAGHRSDDLAELVFALRQCLARF
jgi:hypothetical protein